MERTALVNVGCLDQAFRDSGLEVVHQFRGWVHGIPVAKLKGRYTWDNKRRLEDNIKMDFEELKREGLNWMKLTQYRASVMGCCEQSWATISFLTRPGTCWLPESVSTVLEGPSVCMLHCIYAVTFVSRYSDWLPSGRQRDRSSSSGRVKNFLFSTTSRCAKLTTHLQLVPRWKIWIYTSTPPYAFMA
jgi:hypothetical protein